MLHWQDAKFGRPRTRFPLKCPTHMNTLEELVKVFPDMKVVQTFREPVQSLISVAYLYTHLYGMTHKEVNLGTVRQFALEMIHEMYKKHEICQRAVHDRSFIVNFSECQKDNASFMERLLGFLGEKSDKENMKPILDFLSTSQRFNRGRVRYDTDAFGWNMQEIKHQFSRYKGYLETCTSA